MNTRSAIRVKSVQFLLVICSIILLYTLVPTPSPRAYLAKSTQYYYPLLTKGFLSGQLSLPVKPSAEFLQLKNPYDPKENENYREMFDASFYKGKYYIYFGPLPMVFFIPYTLLTGKLASEYAAIFFFMALGFVISFYLLSKIKLRYFPEISTSQWLMAGLVLGVSNNGMFLMGRPSVYEVPTAANYCFMSLALLFLFQVLNDNFKIKNIFLFSLCLSLCVAGRPPFILVYLTLMPILMVFLVKFVARSQIVKACLALFLPFVTVVAILALYNYLRFDSIFEFGMNYEIADNNRMTEHTFDLTFTNWLNGIYYYFFALLKSTNWVFVDPQSEKFMKFNWVFEITTYPAYFMGYVRSVFTTYPIALFLFALPVLFIKKQDPKLLALLRWLGMAVLATLVIVLFMISLNTVVQRYVTDFQPYIILVALITAWLLQKKLAKPIAKKLFMGLVVIAELATLGLALTV